MNEERFTGKAAFYDAARPAYAEAALDWMLERLHVPPGARVADVGAGTGIFTRQLLRRGLKVYAVEPNADMRAQAREHCAGEPGFRLLPDGAEHTGLPDAGVELVTAAQAFHWFDAAQFAVECRRILRPGGGVALLWNSRVEDAPVVQALAAVCRECCAGFPGFSAGFSVNGAVFPELGPMERARFPAPLSYDRAGFVTRQCSSAYAPAQGTPAHARYCAALGALFDRYAVEGILTIPNETRVFVAAI